MLLSSKLSDTDIRLLNRKISDFFGKIENKARYRVTWSEDEFEYRRMEFTDRGIKLLVPEVRKVPKYRTWIVDKYVLEQLTIVPEINKGELTEKLSYEPIFVFEDSRGNALVPLWQAVRVVITQVLQNIESAGNYTKYKDPDADPEEALENKKKRLADLQEDLFGNETDTTDALAYKEGVVVPSNYEGK